MTQENKLYEKYIDFFNIAKVRANRFFNYHKNLFKNGDFDAKDIEQECEVAVLKTLRKYTVNSNEVFLKPKTHLDLAKLTSQSVTWILNDLMDLAKVVYYKKLNYAKAIDVNSNYRVNHNFSNNEDFEFEVLPEFESLSLLETKQKYINFYFEELHSILTDKEYTILYEITVNKFNIGELPKKLNLSLYAVRKFYNQALMKSKKYITQNKERFK